METPNTPAEHAPTAPPPPAPRRALTHSAMACARTCLRQCYYRYELGLRRVSDAAALRIGAAVHLGLERWSRGTAADAAILESTRSYETCPPWAESDDWEVERETVANLLAGYFLRYQNDPL
ncbi:MAG TPA: PD-(D/E)XK nuclease family protein, partial [Planctomycetota bacterium]|nr:PD-(D/E)XK nuclease family protein [Planctomycetota bacterium]